MNATDHPIHFGTDGWRAGIADEFTFANVRRVAAAVAAWMRAGGTGDGGAVVGYDTRFLSARFARAFAERLAGERIEVALSDRVCPTPALSVAVRDRGAALGIMITASHNPPEDNGIKLKGPYGGPIFGETIEAIQALCTDARAAGPSAPARRIDLLTPYRQALAARVDLDRIRALDCDVVVDSMGGAGGCILADLLAGGILRPEAIRSRPDPLFDGAAPEPTVDRLAGLVARVRARADAGDAGRVVGFATDGDADRIAVLDGHGRFVELHDLAPLLARCLAGDGAARGVFVRSVALHDTLDRVAADLGVDVVERPVGFRHLCERMLDGDVILAAEESGGIGFGDHVPERDGILSALRVLEMIAREGRSLPDLVADLRARYGPFAYRRIDRLETSRVPPAVLRAMVADPDPVEPLPPVARAVWVGGAKFFFEGGGWLLIRVSETEKMTRFYAAGPDERTVERLLTGGRAWVDRERDAAGPSPPEIEP